MRKSWWAVAKRAGMFVATLCVVVLGVMWLSNFFGEKIPATTTAPAPTTQVLTTVPADVRLAEVRLVEVPRYRVVVGTVQAVHETDVGSRLLARVRAVRVIAGMRVKAGQLLVELEDDDLKAKVQQAAANLERAKARLEKAKRDFEKVSRLYEAGVASEQEYHNYKTAYDAARADVQFAENALKEAQTVLSWAKVTSPIDGVVVDKFVEPGDMVRPGQTLVRLYNPAKMQLVAIVPESLARSLSVGQQLQVQVKAVNGRCIGRVSEIVPEAATGSRTFQVKVTGPCPPGIYSGMFGRLYIPIGRQKELRIPASAVRRMGQIEQVLVWTGRGFERRFVRLGRQDGQEVQVLTGLRVGEKVVADYGRRDVGTL